jgi:hypothetical protein
LRALNNLFPADQAERLLDFTLQVIASHDTMGLVKQGIEELKAEFDFLDDPFNFDPLHPHPVWRLGAVLYRHLGLQAAELDPFLAPELGSCLTSTGCGWKDTRDQYQIESVKRWASAEV